MPISGSACHLLTLPDELIVEILSYCPVESVLKVESVRHYLFPLVVLTDSLKRLASGCIRYAGPTRSGGLIYGCLTLLVHQV